MNKAELVASLADKLGISKLRAEKTLNAALACVGGGLKNEGRVQLVGFGTFVVRKKKARRGVNPRTRKPMTIKAHKAVIFHAGKDLKAEL